MSTVAVPLCSVCMDDRRKGLHMVYLYIFLLGSIIYPYVVMVFLTEPSLSMSSVPRAIYWTIDFPSLQDMKSLPRAWLWI